MFIKTKCLVAGKIDMLILRKTNVRKKASPEKGETSCWVGGGS
jgi:hypothetical protein